MKKLFIKTGTILTFLLLGNNVISQNANTHTGKVIQSTNASGGKVTYILDNNTKQIVKTSVHNLNLTPNEDVEIQKNGTHGTIAGPYIPDDVIVCDWTTNPPVYHTITGTVYEDPNTNIFYTKGQLTDPSINYINHTVTVTIEIKNPPSSNMTVDQVKSYLQNNPQNLDGSLELKFDGELALREEFLNSQTTITFEKVYTKAHPCTFDGLSKCTQERIRGGNAYDKTLCILGGFTCVSQTFISCAVDNC